MKASIAWLVVVGSLLVTFVPAAIAQSDGGNSLVGRPWQLVSYGAPGAETPVIADSSATLEFRADNQVVGSGSCNEYGGSYTIEGDRINFSNIVSTIMACENPDVMQQEQIYFEALRSAGHFERANDQLTIWYDDGQQQLRFARQDSSSADTSVSANHQVPQQFENLNSPVDLLASYYNAINRQEYQRAYAYWENPPDPYDAFVNGFADTASVQLIVQPPTYYGGAAGSLYVSIPTVLIAQHYDGTQLTFAGCFVTRKSNLSPPDIPQEDVWHLYSAEIAQVPNNSVIPTLLIQACPP
jgi:heat shock protein HslJ